MPGDSGSRRDHQYFPSAYWTVDNRASGITMQYWTTHEVPEHGRQRQHPPPRPHTSVNMPR